MHTKNTYIYIYIIHICKKENPPSIWNSANLRILTELYCYLTKGEDGIGTGIGELLESSFVDGGYCSTVQGLLDWFEVDLEFTELSFIQMALVLALVSV